jgi:hypothetical protein
VARQQQTTSEPFGSLAIVVGSCEFGDAKMGWKKQEALASPDGSRPSRE